jgi:hypothetical protein
MWPPSPHYRRASRRHGTERIRQETGT